jgi:Periplasmic component of the Tol biopolymer transport system
MSRISNAFACNAVAVATLAVVLSCSGDGATKPITPVDTVASVELLTPPAPLLVDETYQLTGTVHTTAGGELPSAAILWSSSNTAVVTVEEGLVTARGIGVANVIGQSGGKTAQVKISVVATTVSVTPDSYTAGTIGFTSSRNNGVLDAYIVGPDGLRRVTSTAAHEEFDIWSPDAARIAYIRFPPDSATFSSHIINVDGTGDTFVSDGLVTWAPDWLHRAIVVNARLFVSNTDGTGSVAVSPASNPAGFIDGPWWSNDGNKLAFGYAASPDAAEDIWVVNRDGSGLRDLTNTATLSEDFANWSPDGSKLALTGENPGAGLGVSVFTINADGSGLKQLTSTPSPNGDAEPEWSPDGKLIAYTSNVGANIGIWLVDPLGGHQIRITSPSMVGGFGNWSRDGTRIAFTGILGGSFRQNIFVISIDRKSLVQVTSASGDNLNPFWKP